MPLSKVHAVTGTNVIANPTLETSTNTTTPDGWSFSQWGTNTATPTYLDNDGHNGVHSIKTEVTSFTSGAANWFTDTPVTAGTTYMFSTWYKSNVDTTVEVELVNGTTRTWNAVLGTAPASADWKQFTATYTVPAGTAAISVYQPLNKVGWVISDDYSIAQYTPTAFTQGMVSVTLDDGWANQYTNGHPILSGLGLPATYYIISDEVKDASPVDGSDYMTRAEVKSLFDAGNEIGSHTKDHCEMTTGLTEPGGPACPGFDLTSEMRDSKAVLEGIVGAGNVTNLAYPYGSYNTATIAAGQPYYTSQRSVVRGYNSIDTWDINQLKIQEVDSTNTTAEVESWINQAKNDRTWLILCYHEVADTPAEGDEGYNVKNADFLAQMTYLKNSGVAVKTVKNALAELLPQVGGVVTPPATKPGDVNGDNAIDALDLSTVLTNWNKTSATKAQGDLNADGVIDALDLSTVLTNWSK
jgi:peptidoglycan/xylan/chitin deacetylase (PgdA/CDA1 family)